jgi:hypothetical protein
MPSNMFPQLNTILTKLPHLYETIRKSISERILKASAKLNKLLSDKAEHEESSNGDSNFNKISESRSEITAGDEIRASVEVAADSATDASHSL